MFGGRGGGEVRPVWWVFRSIPGCLEGILGSVLGLFRDLLLLLVFTEHSLVIFFDLIMTSEDVETLKWIAARVVTSSSYDRRSVEILYELGWDNLETRRTRQLPAIMFNLKITLPQIIWHKFLIVKSLCIPII